MHKSLQLALHWIPGMLTQLQPNISVWRGHAVKHLYLYPVAKEKNSSLNDLAYTLEEIFKPCNNGLLYIGCRNGCLYQGKKSNKNIFSCSKPNMVLKRITFWRVQLKNIQHAESELLQMRKEDIYRVLAPNSTFKLFLTKFNCQLEYPALQREHVFQSQIPLIFWGCFQIRVVITSVRSSFAAAEQHVWVDVRTVQLPPAAIPLYPNNSETALFSPLQSGPAMFNLTKCFKGSPTKTCVQKFPEAQRPISLPLYPSPDTSLAAPLAGRAVTKLWGQVSPLHTAVHITGVDVTVSVRCPLTSIGRKNLYPNVRTKD